MSFESIQLPSTFQAFNEDTSISERMKALPNDASFAHDFTYISLFEEEITQFEQQKLPMMKVLKAVHLTMQIFLGSLPILVAVSFMYCPLWVPLGIGFPLYCILSLISSKMLKTSIMVFNKDIAPYFSITLLENQYRSLI